MSSMLLNELLCTFLWRYSPIVDDHSPISRCILFEVWQYIADASTHSLLTKNKPRLFDDASMVNCRCYCEYRRTYAVIILRYTPNVRPISANVHWCISDHAEIIRRSGNLFQHRKNFNANKFLAMFLGTRDGWRCKGNTPDHRWTLPNIRTMSSDVRLCLTFLHRHSIAKYVGYCPSHITARDAWRCCGDVKMSNIAEF